MSLNSFQKLIRSTTAGWIAINTANLSGTGKNWLLKATLAAYFFCFEALIKKGMPASIAPEPITSRPVCGSGTSFSNILDNSLWTCIRYTPFKITPTPRSDHAVIVRFLALVRYSFLIAWSVVVWQLTNSVRTQKQISWMITLIFKFVNFNLNWWTDYCPCWSQVRTPVLHSPQQEHREDRWNHRKGNLQKPGNLADLH